MQGITYGGEERCMQSFGGKTGGKEPIWKTGVDGRIFRKWDGGHGLD
jgi:hypothetical protein